MSDTYHHNNQRLRRIVKSSYYKKILHVYGDDFSSKKGKQRWINRLARIREKRDLRKELLNVNSDKSDL